MFATNRFRIYRRDFTFCLIVAAFAGPQAVSAPLPPPRPDTLIADRSAAAGDERGVRPVSLSGGNAVLSAADAARYRRIFDLQQDGAWAAATKIKRTLDSKLLVGHVQYQRLMHPTKYRATYEELRNWLAHYPSHPNGFKIYSLAKKRQPAGAAGPRLPVYGREHLRKFTGEQPPGASTRSAVHRQLAAPINRLISKGRLAQAENAIRASSLPAGPSDRLRAKVALVKLMRGDNRGAYSLAAWAANRSRSKTSMPDWVAGLAAFRLGDFDNASRHFAEHAGSRHADRWNKAAGAYWAGRAESRSGNSGQAVLFWRQAAQYRYTFYGQLAREKLQLGDLAGTAAAAEPAAELRQIRSMAGGKRALALFQAGQIRRADEELLQLLGNAGEGLSRSIMRVARHLKLPQSAVRGAFRMTSLGDNPDSRALYPVPDWLPDAGLKVDQALIWAFVRQESLFNPTATSSAGARGLMQLMPTTANYISSGKQFVGRNRDKLYTPATNLTLGQRYLRYLMRKPLVGTNMFRLLVAYNAGIGNLHRWRKSGRLSSDPLMFIETIPVLETRLFLERVMANFWIYRQRMGQDTPSRTAVAAGDWPRYHRMDRVNVELARDAQHGY